MSRASPSRPNWAPTACQRLRDVMELGTWYPAETLVTIGGRRFAARLFEISRGADRAPALAYDCVEVAAGAYRYRLREYRVDEARPKPRKVVARLRIEELARENIELRRRLAHAGVAP